MYTVAEDCVTLAESSPVYLLNTEKGPMASTGDYDRNQEATGRAAWLRDVLVTVMKESPA